MHYWTRVGAMGEVVGLHHPAGTTIERLRPVVCRWERGLAIGEVLSEALLDGAALPTDSQMAATQAGEIVRVATTEDLLLWQRLQRYRQGAVEACQEQLQRDGYDVPLLDVELTFDGREVWFFFAGPLPPDAAEVIDRLAARYDAKARIGHFAKQLNDGCGPDCGTKDAACGTSSGCAACKLQSHCK
jgi:cell fate regulator YaaT (PSP1 superfamily)